MAQLTTHYFPSLQSRPLKPNSSLFSFNLHLQHRASKSRNYNVTRVSTHFQNAYSIEPDKMEMFESMEGWVRDNILPLLKPVESSWQPQDFLPDSSTDEFFDDMAEIKRRAQSIPDEYYVCLVGNMITEEALPTYQSMINSFHGVSDDTGASLNAWAEWTRSWSAEENRHGDVLNKYLWLSGRLDMRQIEKTIQYLIQSGMIMHAEHNPFRGFIYTSFQERATFVSHGNTARHAKEKGDIILARICGAVAADEKRHEKAYTKIVDKLFELDPDSTMIAFADMMKKRITMPASLMFDGSDHDLFKHYSSVAQRVGVYTSKDYRDILEWFVKRWDVEKREGLSGEGRKAQEYVCKLPQRIQKIEERARFEGERKERGSLSNHLVPFSWLFNRQIMV
ncbi:hypothetical protein LUZ60_014158 [Juncus effusus]|nr:hypothetical protein LUZ60_014158 [Juncus effusus]